MTTAEENVEMEEKTGVTIQVLLTLTILVVNLIFGLIPLFCKKFIFNSSFIGIANAFSGGIFLSSGLFHLIPESWEKFEDYWEKNPDSNLKKYPNTLFLVSMSYVLILFIEKVAFDPHSLLEHGHSHDHNELEEGKNGQAELKEIHSHRNENEQEEAKVVIQVKSKKDEQKVKSKKNSKKKISSSVSENKKGNNSSFEIEENEENANDKNKDGKSSKTNSHDKVKKNLDEKESVPVDENQNINQVSVSTAFVLLIALSIHGFFEGIAMGLQTHKEDFIIIFVAIICHKWAESFTLGQSLSKSTLSLKVSIFLTVLFGLITPAGVILGIFVSDTNKMVEAIMLGLSGGTFLYVSTTEVIVEEFSKPKHRYYKFLALIIAIIVIAITKIVEDHEGHSH